MADNPGYWFLHCHIEVHQLEGMAVIIQEYDEGEYNYNLPTDINKPGKFNWTVADFNNLTTTGSTIQQSSFIIIWFAGLIIPTLL